MVYGLPLIATVNAFSVILLLKTLLLIANHTCLSAKVAQLPELLEFDELAASLGAWEVVEAAALEPAC